MTVHMERLFRWNYNHIILFVFCAHFIKKVLWKSLKIIKRKSIWKLLLVSKKFPFLLIGGLHSNVNERTTHYCQEEKNLYSSCGSAPQRSVYISAHIHTSFPEKGLIGKNLWSSGSIGGTLVAGGIRYGLIDCDKGHPKVGLREILTNKMS